LHAGPAGLLDHFTARRAGACRAATGRAGRAASGWAGPAAADHKLRAVQEEEARRPIIFILLPHKGNCLRGFSKKTKAVRKDLSGEW
jgi:hypothetical protein